MARKPEPATESADEIAVTPEMIEAGVDELLGHDIYPDVNFAGPSRAEWRKAVKAAFNVMIESRSKTLNEAPGK